MTTLPTGEQLPEYDDGPADGVDVDAMHAWLTGRYGFTWTSVMGVTSGPRETIRMVVEALQAVGDATLVKNETYRVMRRDGADVERLAAALTRDGYVTTLVEHGGNPADAAITLVRRLKEMTDTAERILREGGAPRTERPVDVRP